MEYPAKLKSFAFKEENGMKWHAPKFVEVSCGMEINSYAPADGDKLARF